MKRNEFSQNISALRLTQKYKFMFLVRQNMSKRVSMRNKIENLEKIFKNFINTFKAFNNIILLYRSNRIFTFEE